MLTFLSAAPVRDNRGDRRTRTGRCDAFPARWFVGTAASGTSVPRSRRTAPAWHSPRN